MIVAETICENLRPGVLRSPSVSMPVLPGSVMSTANWAVKLVGLAGLSWSPRFRKPSVPVVLSPGIVALRFTDSSLDFESS